jgi:hypothetical protein
MRGHWIFVYHTYPRHRRQLIFDELTSYYQASTSKNWLQARELV